MVTFSFNLFLWMKSFTTDGILSLGASCLRIIQRHARAINCISSIPT